MEKMEWAVHCSIAAAMMKSGNAVHAQRKNELGTVWFGDGKFMNIYIWESPTTTSRRQNTDLQSIQKSFERLRIWIYGIKIILEYIRTNRIGLLRVGIINWRCRWQSSLKDWTNCRKNRETIRFLIAIWLIHIWKRRENWHMCDRMGLINSN